MPFITSENMTECAGLEPCEVFSRFAEVTAIPRGSGYEQAAADYVARFAHSLGLRVRRDEAGNVVVVKPAMPGRENAPGVILQAHLDMVWVKEPGSGFDFSRQPIEMYRDGGFLRARGTTLGADNGIGVAYALAVLAAENLPHPRIEAVFTVDEEVGMVGASRLDVGDLRGRYFINLDSEEEGIFYASCCGGARLRLSLPASRIHLGTLPWSDWAASFVLTVSGLRGGHSGVEIDAGRGNALVLLGRVLDALADMEFAIAEIAGGQADNAIPVSAQTTVVMRAEDEPALRERVERLADAFAAELRYTDKAVAVELVPTPLPDQVYDCLVTDAVVTALLTLPNGVQEMDRSNPEQALPETSANLGVIDLRDGRLTITVSIRSALESKKHLLERRIRLLAARLGADLGKDGDYPGWAFEPQSRLRDVMTAAYARLYDGRNPVIAGIHAGLECGIFAHKFRQLGRPLDLISIGPDVHNVHTPEEALDIASAARTWELLKEALTEIVS